MARFAPAGPCGAGWRAATPDGIALHGCRWLGVTPHRVRCRTTHVVLPCAALPRASGSTELVALVMLAGPGGAGHRSSAPGFCLPPSTLRRWLRRLRGNAEAVRCRATSAAWAPDPRLPAVTPRDIWLCDAMEALGLAASAWVRRIGPPGIAWHLPAMLAGGRFLTPSTG